MNTSCNNRFYNNNFLLFEFSWKVTCSLCKIPSVLPSSVKLNLVWVNLVWVCLRFHCRLVRSARLDFLQLVCTHRITTGPIYIYKGYWRSVRFVWLDIDQVHFLKKIETNVQQSWPSSLGQERISVEIEHYCLVR